MKVPSYLNSSLDLLPKDEIKHVKNAIIKIEELEKGLPNTKKYFAKLIGDNRYVYKISSKYRAIVEIKNDEIKLLKIVHQDKIKFIIRKGI